MIQNIQSTTSPNFTNMDNDVLSQAINALLNWPYQSNNLTEIKESELPGTNSTENMPLQTVLMLNQYWWWTDCVQSDKVEPKNEPLTRIRLSMDSAEDTDSTAYQTPRTKGIKKKSLPQIDEKIKRVLNKIQNGSITEFRACKKKIKGFFSNKSGRRSKYIGVSKNNYNWQVLINVGNKKKYIGTFPTQKEAAVAYDFYSIALHGEKAKTNFNYEAKVVEDMIQSYLSSSHTDNQKDSQRIFEPSLFAERI